MPLTRTDLSYALFFLLVHYMAAAQQKTDSVQQFGVCHREPSWQSPGRREDILQFLFVHQGSEFSGTTSLFSNFRFDVTYGYLNADDQTMAGYPMPGTTVFAGLNWTAQ